MDYLLDTHMAMWVTEKSRMLPPKVRELIEDEHNTGYVSDVSLWEIAIKHSKHPELVKCSAREYMTRFDTVGLKSLPLERAAIEQCEKLDLAAAERRHQDPFDRMLIAQAKAADMLFLTHDKLLSLYGEPLVKVV